MANQNVRGRFVWHELETPERESAHEFYSAVLGWRTEPFEQDPSYAMFSAPSGPLGGAVALRDDGARWLPYVETDDIDATLAEAARLGASVLEDVTAIPNGSKYAILRDPQGACFAVYQSGAPDEEAAAAGKSRAAEVGEFNWHELATEDFGAAFDFYSRLFGWETVSEYDMGPRGVYLIFGREGQSLGGIFNKGDAGLPGGAYWLGYVRVPDVNEASTLVKARGGTVVAGPMEVPGGDWIAQCIDPQGALFALQTSAEDMRSLQGSGADESSSSDSSSSGSSSSSAAAAGDADSDEVAAPKASKKRASKKRAKKKESSKKLSSKKTATKKAGQKKAAKKKVAKKKVAKKKANNKKKAAKKKAVTKKAAAKRPVASKAGSKKAASKKVAKKTGTKKKGTKKKATKKKAANKKASKKKAGKKTKTKTKAKRTTKKARPNRAQAKNKKARAKKARAKKAPTTKTRRR